MKKLQEIKDEYAKNYWGCIDWDHATNYEGYTIDSDDLDRISKLHSKEVAKQALANASEKVKSHHFIYVDKWHELKRTIKDESNIPNI